LVIEAILAVDGIDETIASKVNMTGRTWLLVFGCISVLEAEDCSIVNKFIRYVYSKPPPNQAVSSTLPLDMYPDAKNSTNSRIVYPANPNQT
jgi:hypothetical protein